MYADFDSSARSGRRNRSKPSSMILPKEEDEEVGFADEGDRYSDTSRRSAPAKDAPHCVTCACLSSKMSCSYQQMTTCFDRCSKVSGLSCPGYSQQPTPCRKSKSENHDRRRISGRRRSGRGTTIEELLREMNLSSMLASTEELDEFSRPEILTPMNKHIPEPLKCYHHSAHRCEAGDYNSTITTARRETPSKPMSSRSRQYGNEDEFTEVPGCGRWKKGDGNTEAKIRQEQQTRRPYDCGDGHKLVAPTIDDLGSDNSGIDGLRDEEEFDRSNWHKAEEKMRNETNKTSQEPPSLPNGHKEDLEIECDNTHPTKEDLEEEEEEEEEIGSDAHVQQLKLVRMEFIERIYEEVGKLHRLQRHLDSCGSSRRSSQVTRSVSTMTSARGPPSVHNEAKKS